MNTENKSELLTQAQPIPLLKERQAAEKLGISVFALQRWRSKGGGPQFIKLGRSVRYSEESLVEFLRQNTQSSVGDGNHEEELYDDDDLAVLKACFELAWGWEIRIRKDGTSRVVLKRWLFSKEGGLDRDPKSEISIPIALKEAQKLIMHSELDLIDCSYEEDENGNSVETQWVLGETLQP